jgi:hypothetical protein
MSREPDARALRITTYAQRERPLRRVRGGLANATNLGSSVLRVKLLVQEAVLAAPRPGWDGIGRCSSIWGSELSRHPTTDHERGTGEPCKRGC